MIITWIAVGLAVLILFQQIFTGREFYQKIKEYEKESNKKLQCAGGEKRSKAVQMMPVLFCVLILVYITVIDRHAVQDIPSYSAVCLILIAVFTGSLASSGMYQKLYYSEKGFFWNQRMISFSEITSYFKKSRKRFEIRTKYGEVITLTGIQGEVLLRLLQERQIRIKELSADMHSETYRNRA